MKYCPECGKLMISLYGSNEYLCRNNRCRIKVIDSSNSIFKNLWDNGTTKTRLGEYEYNILMTQYGRNLPLKLF